MASSTCTRDTLLKTVETWLANFRDLEPYETFPFALFVKGRSATCVQHILPASLGVPDQTNDALLSTILAVYAGLKNFSIAPVGDVPPVVDVEARSVAMHLSAKGDTDAGGFATEAFTTFRMTEDGTEIDEIWEFIDSAAFAEYSKKLGLPPPS